MSERSTFIANLAMNSETSSASSQGKGVSPGSLSGDWSSFRHLDPAQRRGVASKLRQQLQQEGRLLFRRAADSGRASEFLQNESSANGVRVSCGQPGVSWIEAPIQAGSTLYRFFADAAGVLAEVLMPGSPPDQLSLRCWTAAYERGEYINLHTDTWGYIQAIMCLENTGDPEGGLLGLRHRDGTSDELINLSVGDAVVFDATDVEHFTTPVKSNNPNDHPRRTVAVGRYWSADPRTS